VTKAASNPIPKRAIRPARRVAAIAGAAVLVLSACGSDGETATGTTTPPLPSTSTTAPPTADVSTTTQGPVEPAAPATWAQVDAGAVTPPARSGAVLAATPDGELWLHGGLIDRAPQGDLWHFNGEQWEEVTAEGAPSPRSEHNAVWDDERDRLVIALGQGEGSEVFDEVWAFDPADGSWSQLASGGPAGRYGSCAVLDDDGQMVITHGFSTSVRFDDTWAFDLTQDAWADVTPTDGPTPSARCLHACGYDRSSDEIVLFGGRNDDQPYLGDTWRLGVDGWRELPGAGPSPRARSRGAFMTSFQVVGGDGSDGLPDDAWTLSDSIWEPGPAGAPADRSASAVAEVDGVMWLFGGLGDDGAFADLWRFG
jgi:hypothetical protein